MLNEMPKIAAPAGLKAKQIICHQSKQSHAKAKKNLLTFSMKKSLKIDGRGLTASRADKTAYNL